MKNIYFLLSASLLIASCGPTTVIQSDSYAPAPEPVPMEDVSYQQFYDQLSPYGNWINYPGYGYVWMPNAGPDFQPYATNGNWILTNAGWTWASNYNWGWAPFHYGRWFYENGYGWIWVPGNEWAPAWVSWRGGGDYYGWAPMGPRISMDVALSNYNPPANYWNFVPRQYMGNPNWHNYYVSGGRNVTIINNTTIINNYTGTNRARYAYAPGPDPNEVRRYSGNNFKPVEIRQANAPGERMSGSQYTIYQPRVSNGPATRDAGSARPSPAPARYESFNNVRPSAQYPAYNNQPTTNPRPAAQNPGNNQPSNNPRPATQNPGYPQPGNNQPVNNPQPPNTRPVTQNPGNQPEVVPPVYNPRPAPRNPANNQPGNNQPVNNPQPGNNQPVNNPQPPSTRPANQYPANQPDVVPPANNPRPAPQNPVNNQPPAGNSRPSQQSGNQPADHNNPQANAQHERDSYKKAQTGKTVPPSNARPAPVNNQGSRPPAHPTEAPDVKPRPQPVEQPKTRDANN